MSKFLLFTFVIILILIPFSSSVSINKLDSNVLTRRQIINNSCYNKAKESVRSTTIVLIDQSGTGLFFISSNLDHGIWTAGCDPSTTKIIPNGQRISFSNQSNGFATGDQGSVVYFIINWDNPFTGSDSYGVQISSKYTYKAPFPSSGDDAYYEITIL
jgi:hypothetical protein